MAGLLLLLLLRSGEAFLAAPQQPSPPTFPALKHHRFTVNSPAELIATITVRCDTCAWDVEGREAVVLKINLDSRLTLHLPIVRTGRAEYRLMLGSANVGTYSLHVEEDNRLTASALRGRGTAAVEDISIEQITEPSAFRALALAPIVYARPDTVGRFTDVPVFMWYEIEPTPRGRRYRYSVVFTNEDGGTPADRLMATWGRTTDIEYLYSVEVDDRGAILDEDMQGPKHETLPFKGRRDGTHPLLWVSTENNMVLDSGSTSVRYAPPPVAFPLRNVSREAVMDAHPWLYEVMTKELMREGKIVPDAPPKQGTIPDPRRFAILEGCGQVGDNALAFALRVGDAWIPSDRGVPEYRIVRDGCFRAAVPLPAGAAARDIRAVRVQAFERAGKPAAATPIAFTRLNTLFALTDGFEPGPSLLNWVGSHELRPGGPPLEIPVP